MVKAVYVDNFNIDNQAVTENLIEISSSTPAPKENQLKCFFPIHLFAIQQNAW